MSQQEKLLISPCKSSVRIEMDGRMTLISPDDADALAEMLQVAANVARDNADVAETAQK